MPNVVDWILLAIILIFGLLGYLQGQDIKRLETMMRIQNNINETQNKKIRDLWMGKNFVPAEPGIDDGFLYDPQKQREHG